MIKIVEVDRVLIQQLYNIAVTRKSIIFLYIIKKLNEERPFLKEVQKLGYFKLNGDDEPNIPNLIKFFNDYPSELQYSITSEFVKKLNLLGISYNVEGDKYTIENQLNIDFEKGGASLKQIHKSIGKGYTKSYIQKIVVGKLKHPRSPYDGKIYNIIEAESIPNQRTKIFFLNDFVFDFFKSEDSHLNNAISNLFFYELELNFFKELCQTQRKNLSQIQLQFENLTKQLSTLRNEKKKIKQSTQGIVIDLLETLDLLIESAQKIKIYRDKLGNFINKYSKFKKSIENLLKKLNQLSFAELPDFYEGYIENLLKFENKNVGIFQQIDEILSQSKNLLNDLSQSKIIELKRDYQTKSLKYLEMKEISELD